MFPRTLDLAVLLEQKSFFLFGPRATGKSTLIDRQLPAAKVYDLLDAETYARLVRHPKLLGEENGPDVIVAIDEIQKLPSVLDEVHRLIARKGMRFLLTGSSARKLRRGASNLLAGRAWEARLFPLTWYELGDAFDLITYLNRGGLPDIYTSQSPAEELRSYTALYLHEEIQAEAVTQNVPAFARFLDAMALSNGEEINYQGMASDCGVSPGTLQNYIEILSDTLVGFSLPGFQRTQKRKAIRRAKHYFFDVGVAGALARRGEVVEGSELFGKAFEHFLIQEIRSYLWYHRLDVPMTYWRSTSRFEVDLVLDTELAIELKATKLVQPKHLKGLRALKEEGLHDRYVVVSLDPRRRETDDGIEIWPWDKFLRALWGDELIG